MPHKPDYYEERLLEALKAFIAFEERPELAAKCANVSHDAKAICAASRLHSSTLVLCTLALIEEMQHHREKT